MRTSPTTRLIAIPAAIRDQLLAHAVAELPREGCGLLAGRDGRIERYWPMRNADASSVTYRLEPNEQLAVFGEIDDLGWALTGIFHSHTHTEAYPSATDRAQALYPDVVYLLASLADRDRPVLRGFTIRDGDVVEHEVSIE